METITPEELKEKVDRGDELVLLETLEECMYRRAHLPSAVLFDDVDKAPELLPDKSAEITSCA